MDKVYKKMIRPTTSNRRQKTATNEPTAHIQPQEPQAPPAPEAPQAPEVTHQVATPEHSLERENDDHSLEDDETSASDCDVDAEHETADRVIPEVQQEVQHEEHQEVHNEEQQEEIRVHTHVLLNGFQTHVANYIWEGTERPVLKLHSHVSLLLSWEVKSDTCTHKWRSLFRRSKLLMVRRASYKIQTRI
ncbi:hypothetical protein ACS0TY_002656 [Phlomoides rotata]